MFLNLATICGNQVAARGQSSEFGPGIAAGYPGDVNIASHPNVLWADNFDSYDTPYFWDAGYSNAYGDMRIVLASSEPENVFHGSKSLEMRLAINPGENAIAIERPITPSDTCFLRTYMKFDPGWNITGSGHNGFSISGNYPGAGNIPNGTDFFYCNTENSRDDTQVASPGYGHNYVYWPEQRDVWGDHWFPDGTVIPYDQDPGDWGPDFVPMPNWMPAIDTWYCLEMMVKLNAPGSRDGRVIVWLDGVIKSDIKNIRFRDVTTLKATHVFLQTHGYNSNRINIRWYDMMVVATSYIGPMS